MGDQQFVARCAAKLARALYTAGDADAAARMLRLSADRARNGEATYLGLAELAWTAAILETEPQARQRIAAAEAAGGEDQAGRWGHLMVLARLIQAYHCLGDSDQVRQLCAQAERLTTAPIFEVWEPLADFAAVVAVRGEDNQLAGRLVARLVVNPADRTAHLRLAAAAEVVVLMGEVERGRELADEAERLADAVVGWQRRVNDLITLAEAACRAGGSRLTRDLISRALLPLRKPDRGRWTPIIEIARMVGCSVSPPNSVTWCWCARIIVPRIFLSPPVRAIRDTAGSLNSAAWKSSMRGIGTDLDQS